LRTRALTRRSAEFVLLSTSEALTAFDLDFSTSRVFLAVLRKLQVTNVAGMV